MAKICIGIPSGDQVYTEFALSLAYLCAHAIADGHQIIIANARTSVLADSRNYCVEMALGTECTHLLFIDSDMKFPSDALERLLEHRRNVVGATYSRRVPNEDTLATKVPDNFFHSDRTNVLLVDALPCGMVLIATALLRKMPAPVFTFEWNAKAKKHTGEDVRFCRVAKSKNCGVWLDRGLSFEVAHIGVVHHGITSAHARNPANRE